MYRTYLPPSFLPLLPSFQNCLHNVLGSLQYSSGNTGSVCAQYSEQHTSGSSLWTSIQTRRAFQRENWKWWYFMVLHCISSLPDCMGGKYFRHLGLWAHHKQKNPLESEWPLNAKIQALCISAIVSSGFEVFTWPHSKSPCPSHTVTVGQNRAFLSLAYHCETSTLLYTMLPTHAHSSNNLCALLSTHAHKSNTLLCALLSTQIMLITAILFCALLSTHAHNTLQSYCLSLKRKSQKKPKQTSICRHDCSCSWAVPTYLHHNT